MFNLAEKNIRPNYNNYSVPGNLTAFTSFWRLQPCMTGSYKDDHFFFKKEGTRRIPRSFGTSNRYLLCCRMQKGGGLRGKGAWRFGCVYGEWWRGECAASHQHSWRHRSLKWAALQTVKKRRGERRNVQAPLWTLKSCALLLKSNKCRFKLIRNHLHLPAGILFHRNSRWTRSVCRVETLLFQRGR